MTPSPMQTQAPTSEISEQDRNLAALSHALVLAGYVVPLANVAAPLIIYVMHKDKSAFVGEQAKESLNFQINQLAWAFVFLLLSLVVVGCFLLVAQLVFELVMVIRATIAAKNGQTFRYPFTIRVI